jgi:hypothetical protein
MVNVFAIYRVHDSVWHFTACFVKNALCVRNNMGCYNDDKLLKDPPSKAEFLQVVAKIPGISSERSRIYYSTIEFLQSYFLEKFSFLSGNFTETPSRRLFSVF